MLRRAFVQGSKVACRRAQSTIPMPVTEVSTTTDLTPKAIVEHLDRYIIGQAGAKRSVAVALRNRWRRHRVSKEFQEEIYPKNILMIGPTGVGKTEIARRVAKLTDAPFLRVECTKFTEVGYHGRDVESVIEDLYKAAVVLLKNKIRDANKDAVKQKAKEVVLTAICGEKDHEDFIAFLEDGAFDDQTVTIEVPVKEKPKQKGMEGQQVDDIQALIRQMHSPQKQTRAQQFKVPEALKVQEEIEMEKLLDNDMVAQQAVKATEEDGIVVLDEIDKICQSSNSGGGKHMVSAQGVQQDLLPLVEGTTVTLKSGQPIRTDHILFIASGAFSTVKPSDMIAELQGRMPLRVELQPLSKEDFYRILTEPKTNLIYQNQELLKTEEVGLVVEDAAIREMADVAFQANATVQNIGARRLITVLEKALEDIGFDAPDHAGDIITVSSEMVQSSVGHMLKTQDLRRLII